jgi:hypothetical protein
MLAIAASAVVFAMSSGAQAQSGSPEASPQVVTAIAPAYPDVAVEARISPLKLRVRLAVGGDGVPTTARMEPEFLAFKEAVETAALAWRFAPEPGSPTQSQSVTLTFLFRLVDQSAPLSDRWTVFRAPYEVEVRHVLPRVKPISVR